MLKMQSDNRFAPSALHRECLPFGYDVAKVTITCVPATEGFQDTGNGDSSLPLKRLLRMTGRR